MNTRRILTVLLEVSFGLAVVAGVIVYAELGPFSWMPSIRWWGLGISTAGTFGYALQWCKRYWRLPRLWLTFIALLLVHSVIYVVVLLNVQEWRLMWFAFIGTAEFFIIAPILDSAGRGTLKRFWGPGLRRSK